MPRVTIIMPVYDHGSLIRYAWQSAAQQTEQDFELFISCDGATAETLATAHDIAASDPRVQVREFPKSARTGEEYRHNILTEEATGEYVCYLSDDDLWLPEHVERLCGQLETNEFASTLEAIVLPGDKIVTFAIDLSLPFYRDMVINGDNRMPLSSCAHRHDAYLRLPHGWRSTPQGISTDHYMWRQWLEQPWVNASSGYVPTVIGFPASQRKSMSLSQREAEIAQWWQRLATAERAEALRGELQQAALRSITAKYARLEQQHALCEAPLKKSLFRIYNKLFKV